MGNEKKKGNDNKTRKIDKFWSSIFDELQILDAVKREGYFIIQANQIKKYHEPRLMTKFDYKDSLPSIFVENNLSILPITRGSYIIGNFEVYKSFENSNTQVERLSFPEWIEGIDYKDIYSEANSINCAYASKMFNIILEDNEIYPTFNGRMSSGEFNFEISDSNNKKHIINVSKAQCEIDGAFESRNKILLLEAKNNVFTDFIIRQLYYPYRLIKERVSKEVIPCFLTYSNNIFSFYIYEVENEKCYNSLKLKEVRRFMIDDFYITFEDIKKMLDTVKIVDEPDDIPFPQANTFENIMYIVNRLYNDLDYISKEQISIEIGVVNRQAHYYSNACVYLGLADRQFRLGTISLSEKGRKILNNRSTEKYLEIFKLILSHRVFNEVMRLYLNDVEMPSINCIVTLMKKNKVKNINTPKMYKRRAQTIKSWLNWIIEIVNISQI
ncbi:type II restriction enzyme [Clostridium botulinum]|uniref:Transcriptional regulator n=1 Tax=Clostridium botulinum TaxID=1491 RepID=A0ABD7CFV4_CLOBO|nr:hypothetical protein [Clostridium botulinum]MCC5423416.1 transcriptional regulator [Clostridium botulinum]QRI52240.1 transcriptional regulator [Clostridium botulinum]